MQNCLLTEGYQHNTNGACLVEQKQTPIFHDRCICEGRTFEECQDDCKRDPTCKGFVEWDGKVGCDIALSSRECAPWCESKVGQYGAENHDVGDLEKSSNDVSGYCGCYVKVFS